MISKINKIKNLGLVFKDYSRDDSLPNFKKFNLIYGWNGSGKTTFSRLFNALAGEIIPSLEYEVEDEQSNRFQQGDTFNKLVRVFNQDYIQNNIKFLDGRANAISISLGEENKELVEQIEANKKLLDGNPDDVDDPGKIYLYKQKIKEKEQKEKYKDEIFTKIAATIGAAIGGNALRTYRRGEAKNDFYNLSEKYILTEENIEKNSLSIKQELLPEIINLSLNKIQIDHEELQLNDILNSVVEESSELLNRTIESELIARLASNEDISTWVEQGIKIHSAHSSEFCEYCRQPITEDRVKELSRHFSEADKKLKSDINIVLDRLQKIYVTIEALVIPDTARFYSDLRGEYDQVLTEFYKVKTEVLEQIKNLDGELKSKKNKTNDQLEIKSKPNLTAFTNTLISLNAMIAKHNKKSQEFESNKKEAEQELKNHYLSTIFDEAKLIDADIAELREKNESLNIEIGALQKENAEKLVQISSDYKACEQLNDKLATFLGHKELRFVPHETKDAEDDGLKKAGYNIMRGDRLATHLSEGEKTAIAFVYFIVHLGDSGFSVEDGIVVIDDPISSLDSNSLYQAFSFLKNAIKDGGQIFILTHNFDFLKLLLNWRRGHHDNKKNTAYFMIKNEFEHDLRRASIKTMDRELCEYESEYHYLFKILKQLRDEQDGTIGKAYPISNIARKVWDTFLTSAVPNGMAMYSKTEILKSEGFDSQKLDAIYKFTNDRSHITGAGFDPSLVQESKKVVNELFDMMKEIMPKQFEIIDKATN